MQLEGDDSSSPLQDQMRAAVEAALGGAEGTEAMRLRAEEERKIKEVEDKLKEEGWFS